MVATASSLPVSCADTAGGEGGGRVGGCAALCLSSQMSSCPAHGAAAAPAPTQATHPNQPPPACCPYAAVFDGHGGFAAAEYLQQNLYRIFTGVLDQQGVEEGLEISQDLPGLACPVALTPALADLYMHADADLLQWMHGALHCCFAGTATLQADGWEQCGARVYSVLCCYVSTWAGGGPAASTLSQPVMLTHLRPALTPHPHCLLPAANVPGEERTSGCTATTCLVRRDLVRWAVGGRAGVAWWQAGQHCLCPAACLLQSVQAAEHAASLLPAATASPRYPSHTHSLPTTPICLPVWQVVVANVGDSRAVLCRGGRALNLSAEHRVWGKTPNVLSEIERIESVGGWVDDGRVCGVLAVSR